MFINALLIILGLVAYIVIGYVAMVVCERHPPALDRLVGQSGIATLIAWALWPLTGLFALFVWWGTHILRAGSDEW